MLPIEEGQEPRNLHNFLFRNEIGPVFKSTLKYFSVLLLILSMISLALTASTRIRYIFYNEQDRYVSFVGGPASTLILAWMGLFPINIAFVIFSVFIFSVWCIVANIVTASQYGESYTFLNRYLYACATQSSVKPTSAAYVTDSIFSGDSTFYSTAAMCQYEHYDSESDHCYCAYNPSNVFNKHVTTTQSNCTTIVMRSECDSLFDTFKQHQHGGFAIAVTLAILCLIFAALGLVIIFFHACKAYYRPVNVISANTGDAQGARTVSELKANSGDYIYGNNHRDNRTRPLISRAN